MSQMSFKDIDTEQEAAQTTNNTQLAKPTGGALATGGQGIDPEDINIDHIQILGKMSQFDPEDGTIGDICANKEFPIAHQDEAVKAILVHTRKYWKENVPFDDDNIPRFANTIEEKKEIEETTEYDGTVPVCDVTLLIERPENFSDDEKASTLFIHEFDGREFALVKYTVQKNAAVRENYGTINVVVRAAATKGKDATGFYFNLLSKEKGQGTKYKWHQFVLKGSNVEAPEEAVAFAKSLRGE